MNLEQFNRRNPIGFSFGPDTPQKFQDMMIQCEKIRQDKLGKNQNRRKYYNGKMSLDSLGIAIPPQLEGMRVSIDWAKKAVEGLAQRSKFDGFSCKDEVTDKLLKRLDEESNFKQKYKIALNDQLVYGCSFITLSIGEEDEPNIIINLHSAEDGAVVWDYRKNRVEYGMTIVDYDVQGKPIEACLYTDELVIHFYLIDGVWRPKYYDSIIGRPLMEVLRYKPTSDHLGQSRITRSVMTTIDCAIREIVRGEIAQEFNTTPQKIVLGADKETAKALINSKWEAYIGSLMAITGGKDGRADVKQLPQGTVNNHTTYMRSLAARFSGETNLPVSVLGVLHDQASSKEAIEASYTELIADAEELNDNNRVAIKNIATMAIALINNTTIKDLTDEQKDIVAHFRNPSMPSVSVSADAAIKLASAIPGFANTETFLELFGFEEDKRREVTQQLRKANAIIDVDEYLSRRVENDNRETDAGASQKSENIS